MVHFLTSHDRVSAYLPKIDPSQSPHYSTQLVFLQVDSFFELFLQFLYNCLPALGISQLFQKISIQHIFAVGFKNSHETIKWHNFDIIPKYLFNQNLTFIGTPQEGKNLVNNVRLCIFFDKSIVAWLRNHSLLQLQHLLLISVFYTNLTTFLYRINVFIVLILFLDQLSLKNLDFFLNLSLGCCKCKEWVLDLVKW